MMMDTIRRELSLARGISDWRISETRSASAETYFVGRDPDCLRGIEKKLYELTVYVDDGEGERRTRGSCTVKIHPASSPSEIGAAVSRAARAASRARNPWYSLPGPDAAAGDPLPKSGFEGSDPSEALLPLRDALYAGDGEGGSRVNSLELFLTRTETRILNSRGLEVSHAGWSGMAEYIVNASAPGRDEIELYGRTDFSEPDYPRLSDAVRRLLERARDRIAAVPTPDCKGLPVLLRDELAAFVYEYWFSASQARPIYEKRAPFALGESVLAGGSGGDPIDLVAVPRVEGSPLSRSHDADGIALSPVRCIEGGVLSRTAGPSVYTQYLRVPTTGALPLFELAGGASTAAGLASVPHLEAAAFSDFFVDPSTGDFGGELRLGYRVEGGSRVPVTGGSVTGNMGDNRGLIRLSSERTATVSCLAPSACLIPVARIAPAG